MGVAGACISTARIYLVMLDLAYSDDCLAHSLQCPWPTWTISRSSDAARELFLAMILTWI